MTKAKRILRTLIYGVGLSVSISLSQNCSKADFSKGMSWDAKFAEPDAGCPSPGTQLNALGTTDCPCHCGPSDDPNDPGLDGGHFDLDTSSRFYLASQGKTDHHVHEYDDKYNVTEVDFFDMVDNSFTEIASRVSPLQEFYIIVANSELSPAGRLEVSGVLHPVIDYQSSIPALVSSHATYTLAGSNRLTSFKMKFLADAITSGGLVPTQTSCVRANKAGSHGEYRNGALTVQILDATLAKLDPVTHAATADGGLLWEATVFWHKDGTPCL